MEAPIHAESDIYDVVGIGFGPSNLALAIALHEHNTSSAVADRVGYRFVERQPGFGWHGGMLIPGTTMQISFLKDLVTQRNPASRFSFLAYLNAKGRLGAFIDHKCFYPSRVEFHDYLDWAAGHLGASVLYGHEVLDISVGPPSANSADIVELTVTAASADGELVLRARNVVIATGLTPVLPPGLPASQRLWHSEDLLNRIDSLALPDAAEFVVVGAGQSAAEVTAFLHRRFPKGRVHAVFSRYGYSPADDSPFVNALFDPSAVSAFFNAPAEVKELIVDYHRNTNYSVVDGDLIHELYRAYYQELVTGQPRLLLHRMSRVRDITDGGSHVSVRVEHLPTGRVDTMRADVIVMATGYRPNDADAVLRSVSDHCKRDEAGRLLVGRDYRVETTGNMKCGIYLQGASEHSHGLSSTLLSNVAIRAGQILTSIQDARLCRTV
jgi:L-ornithine N5-monooxygenase